MARLTFPSDRLVYSSSSYAGTAFASVSGSVATIYSDAAGTTLADVQNLDGSANTTATFTVDTTSRLPLFLGPAAGTDTLYIKVGTGPVTAIYAVTSGDISAAVGTEVTNRTAADAAHVVAADPHGDRAAATTALTAHTSNVSNPHSTTAAQVGAENVVVHGATAGTARPAGATVVHWIGSVVPTNAATNDEWTDITNKILKRWNGTAFDSLGSAASGAGLPTNFLIKTTTYAATAGDYILADATSAGFTVTLPTSPTVGALVAVEKTDTGANIITVSPAGGGTVGGDPNATIITKSAWVFEHSGSNAWRVAAGNGGAANGVTSFNTRTGAVTLSKTDVTNTGLGAADVGAAALEGTTAPPSTNTTGSVLGVATTGAHSDHTHAVGSHDHSTTAKGGQITPTTGLAATGTPSTTTYLRGDNTWGVPAGGSATTPAGTAMVMASGNWTQVFMGRNATATIGSNQSLMGFPFILANAATITTIGLHVNTAGAAASTIRLGIYSTTNGAPASLLVDAGTQAADTTGDKSWTLGAAQALSAGTLYYLAFLVLTTAAVPVIQAGTNTLNSPGTLAVSLPIGSTAAYICAAACCVHNVAVTGALPATFTPSFSAANRDTPCVAFLAQ